jgi:hypothetical protein
LKYLDLGNTLVYWFVLKLTALVLSMGVLKGTFGLPRGCMDHHFRQATQQATQQAKRARKLISVHAAIEAPPDSIVEGMKEQSTDKKVLNKYSRNITQPKKQGASQAMLYATGLTEDDMDKPQVCPSMVI